MSAPTGERPQQPAARRREPGENTPKPSNTANPANPAHRTCCSCGCACGARPGTRAAGRSWSRRSPPAGSWRRPSASWPPSPRRRSRPCPTRIPGTPWRTRPSGPPTPIRGGLAASWRARRARSAPCTADTPPSAASSPPWRPVPRTGRRPRAARP